jgi:hypothetical protein
MPRKKCISPEMRAKAEKLLLDPSKTMTLREIGVECGCTESNMKYINAQLKRKPSESWEELITTRKIIAKLTAEELGNICISKIYDNNVYYTNVHPQYPLEEVEAKIVEYHKVKGQGSLETKRVNELFERSPQDFHGVFCFGPNEENELKYLREYMKVMAREENIEKFTSIFQVVQKDVDDKLLKMLKSSPEPPSSSLSATEASAGSDDPAEALQPTADVAVSKKNSGSKKPKSTTQVSLAENRRAGDEKRRHVIMSELQTELHKRVDAGTQKVNSLQTQIQAKATVLRKWEAQAELLKQSPDFSRDTRSISANCQQAKKAKVRAEDSGSQDSKARLKALEHRRDAVEEELKKMKQELQGSSAKLERDKDVLGLTSKVLKICDDSYQRIIRLSPYHSIVEGKLNDDKLLSIILSEQYNKAQGIHADSKYKGGSILQALGRKQYLIVVLNGYQAMLILNRINPHRSVLLEKLREKLSLHFSSEWIQTNFNADRLWNFLCSCHFDEELKGPIRPVLWPVEEGAYLLVDNLTPHAGAPNNGPDAFRLHWYAYVRNVGVRGLDRDEDQLITIDLLKEYRSLCEYAQRSALNRGENAIFWSPA